jgi:hypothetical protein
MPVRGTLDEPRPQFVVASGETLAAKQPVLGVVRVGPQKGIDILRVEGVELFLDQRNG